MRYPVVPRVLGFFEVSRSLALRQDYAVLLSSGFLPNGCTSSGAAASLNSCRRLRIMIRIQPALLFRLCSLGLTCWLGAYLQAETVERPNIVLILVDDLGKEWISCYGADGVETPNLDAMARGGMRFDNVYSMPQCTPSRVALLTGQYPCHNGWVNHWDVPRWGAGCHFDPSKYPKLLGSAMRELGYATAIAGKWQIDDFRVEPNALDEAGFDQWCMWTGGEGDNPISNERYWNPYVVYRDQPARIIEDRFGPDLYNQFVLDFIKEHQQQPFFVYYPMALVHTPLVPTPDEPDAKKPIDRHKAMVRYMDSLVGKLNETLQSLNLHQRTIVLWTTDNGTARGITGSIDGRPVPGGKAQTTENGINAPTIAYCPGLIPEATLSQTLIDFTDWLPTCVELGGGDPDIGGIDGSSFANALLHPSSPSKRHWIMAMGGQNNAQVTEKGVQNQWVFRDRVFRNARDSKSSLVPIRSSLNWSISLKIQQRPTTC